MTLPPSTINCGLKRLTRVPIASPRYVPAFSRMLFASASPSRAARATSSATGLSSPWSRLPGVPGASSGAAGSTASVLTQCRQVRVVMEEARNVGRARQETVERHVSEAWQVGGTDDHAGCRVHRSRQPDPQRLDPTGRCAVRSERFLNRGNDSVDDVLAAARGLGGMPHDRTEAAAIIRHCDAQLRAAQIDTVVGHWLS